MPGRTTRSVAAGRRIEGFEQHLTKGTPVVRCIPNTPSSIGRGITGAVGNAHVTAAKRATCDALLRAIGEVVWLDEEGLIDAVTAVSGSGPAYVFYLAECLGEAAPEEVRPAVAYLSGLLPQGTIGVGWAALLDGCDPFSRCLRRVPAAP